MTPESLRELCRDRGLVTRELHQPNAFYGHDALLRRYARLGHTRPLKVAIEHGIVFTDFVWQVDVDSRMPVFLCSNAERARLYEQRSGGRNLAVPIGALVRYAAALQPERTPSTRTLLAFPAHSTHHISAEYDADEFADALVREGAHYDRVVVCMYWKDFLAGRAIAYTQRGLQLTTAGHMYDPKFLDRLVAMIRDATMVVTNEVGTCLLYSVLLGRPAWLRSQQVGFSAPLDIVERDGGDYRQHEKSRTCRALFAEARADISAAQHAWVDAMTGRDSFRTPAELRRILDEAEAAYRRRATVTDRARDAVMLGLYVGHSLIGRFRGQS